MMKTRGFLAATVFAVAAVSTLSIPAHAQSPSPLFGAADPPGDDIVRLLLEPQVVRLGFRIADLGLIANPDQPAGADAVLLNLFDDVNIVAVRDRFERRGRGRFSWFGRPAGDPLGSVILVVQDGRLTGSVMTTAAVYDIVSLDDDPRSAIREIDQALYGPEEPPEQE